MNLMELKSEAARLFPLAVADAFDHGAGKNGPLETLRSMCSEESDELGFGCTADCFDAVIPRAWGRLNLDAYSSAELTVSPWTFRVKCRAFWLDTMQVHFEIRHDGPLPGISITGYRSIFAPLAIFADGVTPEEYIRGMFPQTGQLALL